MSLPQCSSIDALLGKEETIQNCTSKHFHESFTIKEKIDRGKDRDLFLIDLHHSASAYKCSNWTIVCPHDRLGENQR